MTEHPAPTSETRLGVGTYLLAGLALVGLLWVVTAPLRKDEAPAAPEAPDTSQGLVLRDGTGRAFTLESLRGKVVLVDVWATWCPPCRESLPEIAALQASEAGRYKVVAVSVDRGGFKDIRRFLAENPGLHLDPVVPESLAALRTLGDVGRIPATFVLGPDGKVIEAWNGYYPGRAAESLNKALGR